MSRLQSVDHQALSLLAELCSTYTPSSGEEALLPVLMPALQALGASIRVQKLAGGGVNVLATWGKPLILYSTHLDVVPPDLCVSISSREVRARGAVDAKGQIAAQLSAIAKLLSEGFDGLAWLGVSREESDALGAREAISFAPALEDCRVIINGEPTSCALALGQRGYIAARLRCHGQSGHGSIAGSGYSAVLSLCSWLMKLEQATPASHPVLGTESWNPGVLEGGVAANTSPESASALISLRTVPGGAIRRAMESLKPENGSVEVLVDEEPAFFHVPSGYESITVPFGSDLPALSAAFPGADAILCGPGRINLAHSPDESMDLSELRRGVELFASLGRLYLNAAANGERGSR